jgi:hypothetical protein
MPRPALNPETLKLIGGVLVVGAALVIMLPGFLNLAAGLGRMALIVGIPLIICGGIALGMRRLARGNKQMISPPVNETGTVDTTGN